MSWLLQRWRTQQTAILNVNCRILWIIETLNAPCALGVFPRARLFEYQYNIYPSHFFLLAGKRMWTWESLGLVSGGFFKRMILSDSFMVWEARNVGQSLLLLRKRKRGSLSSYMPVFHVIGLVRGVSSPVSGQWRNNGRR